MSKGGVYIPREMIKSEAFKQLRGRSIHVLLIFLSKRVMKKIPVGKRKENWIVVNNGKIVFTYREAAEKYGINYSSFSRVIDQLVEVGFIDIARPGIGIARVETFYTLSERWRKYGTKDFERVKRVKQCSHSFVKKK